MKTKYLLAVGTVLLTNVPFSGLQASFYENYMAEHAKNAYHSGEITREEAEARCARVSRTFMPAVDADKVEAAIEGDVPVANNAPAEAEEAEEAEVNAAAAKADAERIEQYRSTMDGLSQSIDELYQDSIVKLGSMELGYQDIFFLNESDYIDGLKKLCDNINLNLIGSEELYLKVAALGDDIKAMNTPSIKDSREDFVQTQASIKAIVDACHQIWQKAKDVLHQAEMARDERENKPARQAAKAEARREYANDCLFFNIPQDADKKTARQAYKKLILERAADKNNGNDGGQQAVQEAWVRIKLNNNW